MTNPFENNEVTFKVLQNFSGEYSLWPGHIAIPDGWEVQLEASRAECIEYVDKNWNFLHPIRTPTDYA